jgi:hypothetical protein
MFPAVRRRTGSTAPASPIASAHVSAPAATGARGEQRLPGRSTPGRSLHIPGRGTLRQEEDRAARHLRPARREARRDPGRGRTSRGHERPGLRLRREAGPDSDLDLLVTFGPSASLLDLIGLEQELADLLGIPVEVASDRGLRERIRATVMQEAVPL